MEDNNLPSSMLSPPARTGTSRPQSPVPLGLQQQQQQTGSLLSRAVSPPPPGVGTGSGSSLFRASVGSNFMAEETKSEKEVMLKEKQWVIANEAPFVCKEVQRILQECMDSLFISYDQAKARQNVKEDKTENQQEAISSPKPIQAQLISFEAPDGVAKGHMRVEGYNIVESDFTVKSAKWNKNLNFKTTITPVNPLRLNQVQLSLSSMKDLETFLSTSNKEDKVKHILQTIEEASHNLKNAIEELLLPPSNLFPRNATISQPNMVFQPALPSDLMVEFSIQNTQIVLTVHFLHKLNPQTNVGTPTQTNHQQNFVISKDSVIGQRYLLSNNNLVEVVDFCQVPCAANIVKSCSTSISSAYQLCTELRDKMVLFLGW